MPRKLLIFDLDGTVLDTLEDIDAALNHVLRLHGFPPCLLAQTRSRVGNGNRRLIARSVPEGTADEVIDAMFAEFSDHYRTHCHDRSRPYPGIPELLSQCVSDGYETAVLSNKEQYAVDILCSLFFPGLFMHVLGGRPDVPRKPSPDAVLALMEQLGLCRNDVLFIGDSEVDLATAVNAKIPCVAVTWGFRDESLLKDAAVRVHTPEELLAAIRRLLPL
ncbi:MAG: HAD-IA family hydrolase [Clostridia bacterium]|nr:HAD-IA family hydrolase [Clostridia bacterium]